MAHGPSCGMERSLPKVIDIDPVTRLEGHYAVRVEYDGGKVVKAYSSGEMFRGFEIILRGRDPMDAQQITQRICGVCPISHGTAPSWPRTRPMGSPSRTTAGWLAT